ncbi:hypothetical protein C7413_1372 [Paraburkholderia silvatlantica]|nr:hypothetical protein C7411_1362 [Paraburkholderia silvatlantica]PXW26024.1 hypothetical protein C7413_1372 [Paraburkholderia silvatlantica]
MRRCFLHIGTHKTGTSSIQRSLAQVPSLLSKAGFYFPNSGKWTPDSGHHGFAVAASLSEYEALADSLIDEIALIPHHIILSSEEFTHMLWRNTQGFQRFVDRILTVADRVTVILYLRRQPDFIESNYLERLKSRFRLGFSPYAFARIHEDLAEFPLDYRRLIDVLDRVHNIDVDVRSYDSIRTSGALPDFLSAIEWPADHSVEECRVNESLPIVESLKNFYHAQMQRALSDAEERAIELIAQPLPAHPRMDFRTRRHLIQQFAAGNLELANRFPLATLVEAVPEEHVFGDWTGIGDVEPPHQESIWQVTLDHLFSRTFIEIVQAVSERLGTTQAALEQQQRLALERHTQISTLQQALATTQAALTTTQTLAFERYAQLEKLNQALVQTKAVPKWRRIFRR